MGRLTKAAIAAAAAKLIESIGASEFSLRKLAKALDVGPTTIHAHFKGGAGAILGAVAALALAGARRPFKPREEPAGYLRELLLKNPGGAARSIGLPEERWPSVDAMLDAFRRVRRAQLGFTPTRAIGIARSPHEDWSTQAVRLVERGDFRDAELVARAEFESSRDEQAFLIMG